MSTTTLARPTTPVPPPVRRRSSTGFWIGGLLVAAAVAGAIIWAVLAYLSYRDNIDAFPRGGVGSSVSVHVTSPRTEVVYYENARSVQTPFDLGVVATAPDGTRTTVSSYGGDLRYDVPGESGRVGRAVAVFRADQVGDYTVTTTDAGAAGGSIAIGGDISDDVLPDVLGAGALLVLGGGTGIALILLTAVRRSSRT